MPTRNGPTSRSSTSGCPSGRASRSRASSPPRCHVVFVTAYDEYAVAAFDEGAVDYVLKPPMPERIAKVVARLKTRLAQAPLDLTALLAKLAARADGDGPLKWIRASLGASMKLIPVDEVLYFRAEDKYTKVVTHDGEALDPETDQGALRSARPRNVLADPPRLDRQSPRDTARRSRLARRARDRAQGPRREARGQPDVCAPVQGDVGFGGCRRPPAPRARRRTLTLASDCVHRPARHEVHGRRRSSRFRGSAARGDRQAPAGSGLGHSARPGADSPRLGGVCRVPTAAGAGRRPRRLDPRRFTAARRGDDDTRVGAGAAPAGCAKR